MTVSLVQVVEQIMSGKHLDSTSVNAIESAETSHLSSASHRSLNKRKKSSKFDGDEIDSKSSSESIYDVKSDCLDSPIDKRQKSDDNSIYSRPLYSKSFPQTSTASNRDFKPSRLNNSTADVQLVELSDHKVLPDSGTKKELLSYVSQIHAMNNTHSLVKFKFGYTMVDNPDYKNWEHHKEAVAKKWVEGVERLELSTREDALSILLTIDNNELTSKSDYNEMQLKKHEIVFDEQDLHLKGEKPYQVVLNKANTSNEFVNITSESNGNAPIAKSERENVYPFSAKPGLLSRTRPMFLEIKGNKHATCDESIDLTSVHYEVIKQAVERVYCSAMTCQLHRRCICFAGAHLKFFAIVYERSWQTSNKSTDCLLEYISIIRIKGADIPYLWSKLSYEAYLRPNVLYTDVNDASIVNKFIHQITDVAWPEKFNLYYYCRIVVVGASSARVYAVTFPQYFHFDTDSHCLGVSSRAKHFCLKVFKYREVFDDELKCLRLIWEKPQAGADCDFYALGALVDGVIEKCDNIVKQFAGQLKSNKKQFSNVTTKSWWQNEPVTHGNNKNCCAIIMRAGQYRTTMKACEMSTKAIVHNLLSSLADIHCSGILHCDIRVPNCVAFFRRNLDYFFNQKTKKLNKLIEAFRKDLVWRLIDFNCATSNGKNIWIQCGSGQHKSAGCRVHKLGEIEKAKAEEQGQKLEGYYVDWSAADDYEMLSEIIMDLSKK